MRVNKGNTTVEMCFVMPIIVFVIILFVGLYLNLIITSKIWGDTYIMMYSYYKPELDRLQIEEDICERFNSEEVEVDYISADSGRIKLEITQDNREQVREYMHSYEKIFLNREYDLCTSRLRRWQLYGDVFFE